MSACVEQVQASLAQARDAQVARVVAVVDAMPDRGAADALIAPLRPRLAALRPARPRGFTRVMFTPLDSVLVPLAEWRRGGDGVPRSVLSPIGAAVRGALPDMAEAVSRDAAAAAAALWSAAASVVDRLDVPATWEAASGLNLADYPPIKAAIAAVLHEATPIEALADGRIAMDNSAVGAILGRSKARGAVALDTVLSVLLARLPSPDRVVAVATVMFGSGGVLGRAVDRLGDSVATQTVLVGDASEAAREAARLATLLGALETGAAPERRARLDAIRRDADALCRRSFGEAVTQSLALATVPPGRGLDDEGMATLEGTARDLRRLATAARKLGRGDYYDAALAHAATAMEQACQALGEADRVRLLEILVGSEQALALLADMQRTSPGKG